MLIVIGTVVIAIAMNFAASILIVDVLDAAIDPVTGGAVVPDAVSALLTALLVGAAVGFVVGSRVTQQPVAMSVAVMIIYLALWPMAVIEWRGSGPLLIFGFGAHVTFAALAAWLIAGRKRKWTTAERS
jgi:hypothetical protein